MLIMHIRITSDIHILFGINIVRYVREPGHVYISFNRHTEGKLLFRKGQGSKGVKQLSHPCSTRYDFVTYSADCSAGNTP